MSNERPTIHQSIVAAQKAFGPAVKNAVNPHLKNKYADLAACIDAVVGPLNDNGLALIQKVHDAAPGLIAVETVFLHETGQEYSAGIIRLPAARSDAQGYGSALTYARRYSLLTACGIAPEDDDGNAASKRQQKGALVPASTYHTDELPDSMQVKPTPVTKLRDAIDGDDMQTVGEWRITTRCSFSGKTVREVFEADAQKLMENIGKLNATDRMAVEAYGSHVPLNVGVDLETGEVIDAKA